MWRAAAAAPDSASCVGDESCGPPAVKRRRSLLITPDVNTLGCALLVCRVSLSRGLGSRVGWGGVVVLLLALGRLFSLRASHRAHFWLLEASRPRVNPVLVAAFC